MAMVEGPNKDKRLHLKWEIFKALVGMLLNMILGHTNYQDVRNWDRKIQLVRNAMGQLKDPLFSLKQLESLMQPLKSYGIHTQAAELALKELQSFFLQSKLVVQNQDCASEIQQFPSNSIEDLQISALKEAEKESETFLEELTQIMTFMEQSPADAKVYNAVASALQKVVNHCSCRALYGILNRDNANQIQGHHAVEIISEQLRVSFPQIPDSTQINQKGKNDVVHKREMIVQEKLGNEVIITLQLIAGRLAELKLAGTITYPEMVDLFAGNFDNSFDEESIWKAVDDMTAANLDEGTTIAAANVKLSPDETCMVQGYNVFKHYANALDEIFRKHPNVAENFQVACPNLQSPYMNLLVEVYQKIMKSEDEMIEPEDIKDMAITIEDMKRAGLQVTWLEEMLEDVQEISETREMKLLEKMESLKAETIEVEQKLNMLKKKQRFRENSISPRKRVMLPIKRSLCSMQYLDSIPLQIQKYVVDIIDVSRDGHCGFRSIAGLLGFGSDKWAKVRWDLIEELFDCQSYYLNFYGSKEVVDELSNRLCWFKDVAPLQNWMTLPDMGHLIASKYNVVLVHISAKQCLTYLPLRSTPPSPLDQRIIVIGFVNHCHFVQILMDPASPIPPVACNWYKFRHDNAQAWETPYLTRIEVFKSLISKDLDVAIRETIV